MEQPGENNTHETWPATAKANGSRSVAFGLYSVENTLVEGNMVGLVDDHLMIYLKSRNVQAFNNVTPAGQPVPLTENTSGVATAYEGRGTFEDKVNDAILMSLL